MFLKSIEMTGFKSFPDKIDLTFPRGITCVVGPNGSGKSNISDALRWVMGEQSVKTLRGGKMEDVIFSGTQKRKPLGICEVNLTVDNSDRSLPMDADEIVVTRRIFRSGDCEYYINRSSCRLKDIHELFMDTGLGKDGYSLVGQGKIDEIISGKPMERRTFFEEACGISKYHHKKNDAERKLNSTNDNIVRINDIITELEGRLEPLRLQSEKAKKYLVLKEELKKLEINLSLINYDKLAATSEKAEDEFLEAGVALDKLKTAMEENDADIERFTESIRQMREKSDALTQMTYNSEYDIKTFENQIEIANNNIAHCETDIIRIEDERKEVRERKLKLKAATETILSAIKREERKKEELLSGQERITSELSSVSGLIEERNNKLAETKSILVQKQNDMINLNVRKSSHVAFADSLKEQMAKASAAIKEKKESIELNNISREEAEAKLERAEKKLEETVKAAEKLEKEISGIIHESGREKNSLSELENEKKRISERLDMLKEAENSYLAYPKGIKEVMEADLPGVKLYGTLASLIHTEGKYADAIDGALGGKLGNIVCENENDAKNAISFLKKNKAGRVTFLPVSSVKPKEGINKAIKSEKGFIAVASELISCDGRFKGIVEALLNQTAVFEDMDTAVAASRKFNQSVKIATLGGEIFSKGGSVTGGELKVKGAMKRLSEINSLEEKLEELPKKLKDAAEAYENAEQKIKDKKKELSETVEEKENLNNEKINLLSVMKYYSDLNASYEKDLAEAESELKELEKKLDIAGEEIKKTEEEYIKISEEASSLEKLITAEDDEMSEVFEKRDRFLTEIEGIKISIAAVERDISYERDKVESNEALSLEYEKEIAEKTGEIARLKEKISDIKDEIQFRVDQIQGLRETIEQYAEQIEECKKKAKEYTDEVNSRQSQSRALRDNYLKKSDENTRLEMRVEKLKADMDSIINSLWESYELTVSEARKLVCDIGDYQEASKRASELKHKIRSLGNINLDSVEEYEEVNERYTFLTGQRDDLSLAKTELEKIISDMTLLMKKIFTEQFALIAKSFNETYIELFGGGRAELKLADEENVLESGIEIEVQPPGKKLTVISLLSGGEKAFAAIALLFSIIKIRPTPFCLFDEIEAALDDVNVYKYADFLEKFKKNTQFIVISHRRGTMEAADTLYGVTMQEKGVSKLLQLNIDEVEEK